MVCYYQAIGATQCSTFEDSLLLNDVVLPAAKCGLPKFHREVQGEAGIHARVTPKKKKKKKVGCRRVGRKKGSLQNKVTLAYGNESIIYVPRHV